MKRLFSLLILSLLLTFTGPGRVQAAAPRPYVANDDTIIVKLPNQATMTLVVRNKEQLRELRTYHLDSLVVLLDGYITQAENAGKSAKTEEMTLEFYPDKDKPGKDLPQQIRITVRGQNDGKGTSTSNYKLGDMVSVVVKEGKDNDINIKFGDSAESDSARDARQKAKREERAARSGHNSFNIDLGLNALVNRPSALLPENDFDLRPTGSRYISLDWHYSYRLGGRRSPVYLLTGPELAFNNYMFDGNRRLAVTDQVTQVVAEPNLSLQKSKLAVTTINMPLMLLLNFDDSQNRDAFRLGAGGFVGYRLGAHTKLKYDVEGRTHKDKDRGSFNLEEFQYGVQGLIGFRDLSLFAKYNLNELFKENRGPQAQTVSFGITFCDLD